SMLDDLGLGPALEWQAREFSRRYDVPVDVSITGDLHQLPESHRTCVYRIAQEALTNCARHSQATAIELNVHKQNGRIEMEVRDNGIGLPTGEMKKTGLGLRGMQERVRDLGGKIAISSSPSEGTTLAVELPLATGIKDEQTSNITR
ncbi:MAG: sensor histidine kinase, partial [Bryobacteraceae bacterium]